VAAIIDKAKEAFAGVFGSSDKADKEPINTPEQQNLVDMAINDYQYFKSERQRHEPIWRQEQRFYRGDHWHGLRPPEVSQQRPNSVDNVAWSQIESITAKLCSWEPYPEFEPQEQQDEQKAQELNAYMPYELRCIRFHPKHIRAVRRMAIHGPLIYKVVYDPTVEGGSGMYRYNGNNDIIPVELGSFFPDPRIRDFIDLQKGAAHMFHFRKPMEYFKQRWPKQGAKVQSDMDEDDVHIYDQDDYSMRNFNSDRTGGDGASEIKTAGLIEYWYRGKPKIMSREDKQLFKELADEKLMEGKDPSECLAKSKGTMNGVHCLYLTVGGVFLEHKSYVYDHGHYPIVARTLFPDEDNPWGKGYMRDMMKPQIMLNKFAEISVETMAKEGNSGVMYEPDAIAKPEKFRQNRSTPGALLEVARLDGVKELQGVNVPSTVFNMLEYYKEMLQKIPGQFDSANGQANSNVKSGEQAKALIAAANNRLVIPTGLIEDALAEAFEQYISNMAQFYSDERIGRVTGKQVSMSRDRLINHMPTEYETGNEVIDPQSGMPVPEKLTLQEEYVPKFDIGVKISVEKPTDRDYWIQTAFNMMGAVDPATGMPLIDGEAVRYTVQNGRMEPFDVIDQRMQKEQQRTMQIQQLEAQNQQLQAQMQQIMQQLGMAEQNNVAAERDMMQMQQDEQRQMVDVALKNRKLDIEEAKVLQQGQPNTM
jgi:hypothetical protein